MKPHLKKKTIFLVCGVLALIVWSIVLHHIDVNHLVQSIGVTNVYMILFFIALTSGTSFLTSAAFYTVFLSYVSATDLHPLLIAVCGGVGMSIGDGLYFLFARKAGEILHENESMLYQRIHRFFTRLPRWSVYIFTYLYASFSPLPNDILMVTLGAMRYRFRHVWSIIIVGNITLLVMVAYGIHRTFF